MPEVLNEASLFRCDWARPPVSQHITTCGICIQDLPLSNRLVLLSLALSKYSPVLGQSPEGHLRVELWASPPSQGTLPINSSLLKVKVKVKSLSRVRLCDPMDCSPPGSSVHWILQARILEWIAISFSRGSSRPRNQTQVSRIVGRHRQTQAYALTSEPPGSP